MVIGPAGQLVKCRAKAQLKHCSMIEMRWIIIIIMHHLTRCVSVIRMTNRSCNGNKILYYSI